MKRSRLVVLVALLFASGASLTLPPAAGADAPAGQLTWAVPVTLAPAWFDPADATGILTPFTSLNAYGPRVAESGLGLIENYLFSAPYEEVKLKSR